MRKFIEFPKLPLGKEGIPPVADRRRIFVVLLPNECVNLSTKLGAGDTNLEISEKRIHEDIRNDQRCEYRIQDAHKYETSPEAKLVH